MAVLGACCDDGRRVPAVTIFGWDDVLCPTTHAKLERKKRATQPLGVSSSKQDRKELLKVGTSVVRCVQAARRHGPVVIVTESDEHWVRGTAELLLPGSAAACLQNVEVVSSRGRFGTDFPCQPACWQIAAFSYVTNRYLLSPAAAAEVGIGPRSGGAKAAVTTDLLPTDLAAKDVATKKVLVAEKDAARKDVVVTKDVAAEGVLLKDVLPKDLLPIGTVAAAATGTATATATATANTAAVATPIAITDTGGGDGEPRQEVRGGGVEGGGGGVGVSDDADGAAGGAAPPPEDGNGDCKGGDGEDSSKGSGGGSGGDSGDDRGGGDGSGFDAASAESNWGRGTLIAVSTAPRVWEDKSATSTLREHHPKIVAKTVSLIKAPTPLELRKQLDLLAENFGLMFGHSPPRDRARARSRSRSRSRSRAGKLKKSSSVLPSPSSSTSSLSSSSLPSSSPDSSPRGGGALPCSRSRSGRVSGVGVGGRGFTGKGIGDSDEEDYAATTSSTATSSTGRSADFESASPGSSDWDDPPFVMRGRAGGPGGGCASGLGCAEGGKEGPTVAAVAAAAGGPW